MSILSKVTRGIVKKPYYILPYGEPGLGKSTFASKAPNPIFLCTEDGTDNLDVERIRISSFQEMISTLSELATQEHEYKTIVVDTLDHFEPMIWNEVMSMKENSKYKSIESIGYSKGYIFALDFWNTFITAVEALRAKGMNIILLAHSYVKAHNDPQLDEAYDKYQIKLHHKAASMLIDRVDCVMFTTYKTYLDKKDSGKNKAYGDGTRIMYTENRPAFVAKNRFNLPFELPLSWEDFDRACNTQAPKSAESMIKFIEENINQLDETIREKARKHFEKNRGNPSELAIIETRIKAIISTKTA